MVKKSRIVHVMYARFNYCECFGQFCSENFGDNQYFCPIGNENDVNKFTIKVKNSVYKIIFDRKKVIKTFINMIKFIFFIDRYDIIIWHSLLYNRYLLSFIALFKKNIIHKSIWMVWGGDLYDFKSGKKYLDFFYKKFVENLGGILVAFPGDREIIYNTFNYNGKIYEGYYGPPTNLGVLKYNAKQLNKNNYITIMIGHCAIESLNHIKYLKMFLKFRNNNIKIFLPLNYGDLNYAKKVVKYAKDNYNEDKLIILNKKIQLDVYLNYLYNVDICVLDEIRQIALGNLFVLLANDKSLYLNPKGVMYKYWKSIGLNIKSVNEIIEIKTLENLVFKPNNSKTDYIKNYSSDEVFLKMWKDLFQNIERDFNNK